ncbi:serine/threonine protein kinase [Rhodopirellula bahusiensis]|uniref:Serine/threonine protein kinase n=1 Tax=Rhodopirellula bahusiensis TaxID=2014065 RepID=A0A2G1VZG9_9BACT|nr:serine/threonine-protein kinase [Rhodopirellula bahusiensis]PHQ32188.1 serine/threonine protein kinase [Rhodopirellula bahusiensis]
MPHLRLNDFELGAVLGVGTVGTVYDGKIRDDIEVHPAAEAIRGQDLAVKKLHPAVSQDDLIQARFRREMVILERLQHPNIIGYFGGGSEDGQLFYVMERVDGGTIKDLLETNGALAWPVVVDVARQVCSALQCAHNHGVIHRDLKPGNLFLTRDAHVKLGDFGIARDQHSSDLTSQGLTVGTHAYMAPEQITGDETISGKADLYALGCVLFEMLANRKVFAGENFAQLFEQHLRTKAPDIASIVSDVPPELNQVIAECLEKSPDDRPFNARSVQGVMIEIGEKYDLSASSTPATHGDSDHSQAENRHADVSADSVTEKGRRLLEEQIHYRLGGTSRETVGLGKVSVIVIAIIVLIALAVSLSGGS